MSMDSKMKARLKLTRSCKALLSQNKARAKRGSSLSFLARSRRSLRTSSRNAASALSSTLMTSRISLRPTMSWWMTWRSSRRQHWPRSQRLNNLKLLLTTSCRRSSPTSTRSLKGSSSRSLMFRRRNSKWSATSWRRIYTTGLTKLLS